MLAHGIRVAIGLQTALGDEAAKCTCSSSNGGAIEHLRNCGRGGGRIRRHDDVVNALAAMLTRARLRPAVEARAEFFGAGNGGPDIAVNNFPRPGLDAFVEFSVVNPTQQRYAQPASNKHLVAADDREEEKRAKYAKLGPLNVRTVWAAAMETTGAFGKGLQSLIKNVVDLDKAHMAPGPGAPWLSKSPRAYWRQRISVAFHRAAYDMAENVAATATRNDARARS